MIKVINFKRTFALYARNLLLTLAITNKLGINATTTKTPAIPEKSFYCTNSDDCKSTTKMSDASDYKTGDSSVVFVTTPDENAAKKIAHGLINQKLAACVNILPQIQSIYMWEGKVNEDNELLLMIKTRSTRVEELTKWVRDNHPYSVAEVIALPIEQGNAPYLKWIKDVVPPEMKTE